MNVGLLIVTHGDIGEALMHSAVDVLGVCPISTTILSAPTNCNPENILKEAALAVHKLDSGDGVLVLTDMYGATPSNIACKLYEQHQVRIVSGLNLPMLIRVLNYPDMDLDELSQKALTGGRDGVLACGLEGATHAG